MRHFPLLMVFVMVSQVTFSQSRTLDSLYKALENHPTEDTVRVNALFSICYREYTSQPEKNKVHAEEAMRISKTINFAKGTGYANRYLSLYYWATGDYAQATQYAYQMLQVFEGLAATAPKVSNVKGLGQAYQLLGLINEIERDYVQANSFYRKALEIYQRMNLKRDMGYGYNSLGSLQLVFEKYDLALECFQKSLEIRKEINDQDGLSQTYGNLAHVYTIKKDYTKALEHFEKAFPILQRLNNRYRIAANYNGMGELYMLMGKYDQAELYMLKGVDVAKSIHHKMILEETYNKLTTLEKERGRFEGALKYAALASIYKDSIYTEQKAKQIAEVEARYETEKKDKVIQLLERDKEIQSLWTNIIIVALVLVIVISVEIYLVQRYRESKNRQILNLEIDYLTNQHKQLSEKYKDRLTSGDEKSIESQDQRLLKKTIEVVEEHMDDPLFGVEKMAREIGMSRTNLHRKVKAITGFPPSELIRSIRLRKAAVLLLNHAGSVSQISYTVGFEDHSYFSKSFKKQFGVSPSEYGQSKGLTKTPALEVELLS